MPGDGTKEQILSGERLSSDKVQQQQNKNLK